jgi:hypothetical protein
MRLTPKTEQELNQLWPAGEYNFEILERAGNFETKDTTSQKGNEMIALAVKVINYQCDSIVVFDYLMESIAYKLRHAAAACGLLGQYETGELYANQFIGKTGRLILKTEKDKTGQYPDKNAIKDYCVPKDGESTATAGAVADDNIPFMRIFDECKGY